MRDWLAGSNDPTGNPVGASEPSWDEGVSGLPLSEEEKRILKEIEQQLIADDPELVRQVAETTVYRVAFRNLKWAVAAFLVGVVVMVGTLSASVLAAFGGFLIMLAAAFFIERNARRLGRAGWEHISRNLPGLRSNLGGAGQRMRDRFRREDP